MTEIILTITVTIPDTGQAMPDGIGKPEPVLTGQPVMCRCHVLYGTKTA